MEFECLKCIQKFGLYALLFLLENLNAPQIDYQNALPFSAVPNLCGKHGAMEPRSDLKLLRATQYLCGVSIWAERALWTHLISVPREVPGHRHGVDVEAKTWILMSLG